MSSWFDTQRPPRHAPSSGDQAARFIRELIFDGRLPAGAHVPQDEIAGQLGMSRIPIREALIALERQGWVHIERHRGAFVTSLDPQTVRDHYQLYGLLYAFAVRRAVERHGADLAEALGEAVTEMQDQIDDPVSFGQSTRRFHAVVVSAAGTSRVPVALRSLSNLVPGDFFTHVDRAIPVELDGLTRIHERVAAGEGEGAAEIYSSMMGPVGDLVVELFEQRNLFGPGEDDGADDAGVVAAPVATD